WLDGPARSFAEPLGEKIVLDRQLADLGVQLLDRACRRRLRVHPDLGIEHPRRMVQQLLLLRIDLVRMNLVTLRQVVHCRLLAQRLDRNLRLQPRVNLPSRLRHVPLRSKPFGADFLQPSQWSQKPGPLQSSPIAAPSFSGPTRSRPTRCCSTRIITPSACWAACRGGASTTICERPSTRSGAARSARST